jgi:uncharacterized cupin superfamily protein
LPPGAVSALHHRHARQDEFNSSTCLTVNRHCSPMQERCQLCPGMAAGFAARGTAHHLENRTGQDCVILEVGDRTEGDEVSYPTDDIQAVTGDDGKWRFSHKNGESY